MKQFDTFMKRLQAGLLMVMICLMVLGFAGTVELVLGQDAASTAPKATMFDAFLAALKVAVPQILAFLSAYLTKLITWGLSLTPTPWLGVASSFVGALGAAMTSAVEGLSVEAVQAQAVLGGGSGALGHVVMQSKPIQQDTKPAQPTS